MTTRTRPRTSAMTTPTQPAEPSTEAGRYRRLMEREAGLREKARRGESWESTTDEDVALLLWEIDRLRADSTPAQELLTDRDRRIAELEASRDAAAHVEALREALRRLLPEVMEAEIGSVIGVDPATAIERMKAKGDRWIEARAALAAEPVPAAGLPEIVAAWDAYVEATAGRGHESEPHDRAMADILRDPDEKPQDQWSTLDVQRACSKCAGAQYGTEADLSQLMDAARLSAPEPLPEREGAGRRE